ncbi:MAG: hypothetical protein PWP14_1198 [Methanolobus sp.]|nr:hypothetical protein [Methanolobus sp.]
MKNNTKTDKSFTLNIDAREVGDVKKAVNL